MGKIKSTSHETSLMFLKPTCEDAFSQVVANINGEVIP